MDRRCTRIYFRLYPLKRMDWKYVKLVINQQTIYVRCLQELKKGNNSPVEHYWRFDYDYIFFNDSQKTIYCTLMEGVLPKVFYDGINAVIIAYGQTGTGKSLTTTGVHNRIYENRGILPRIINDVFCCLNQMRRKFRICIQIAYFETARNELKDLLRPLPNGIESLKCLSKIKVKTLDDALEHLFLGESRKEFTKTSTYYSHSSSSIFTFYIYKLPRGCSSKGNVIESQLHVLDLAGADTSGNCPCRFKSADLIGGGNLTKTFLDQYMKIVQRRDDDVMRTKRRTDYLLAHLKDALTTTSLLRFIGHIRTDFKNLAVTLSMLRFAQMLQGLKMSKSEWESFQPTIIPNKIEVCQKRNISEDDICYNLEDSLVDQERYNQIKRRIDDYLNDTIQEFVVTNTCDINIALQIIKTSYKNCRNESTNLASRLDQLEKKLFQLEMGQQQQILLSEKSSTNTISIGSINKSTISVYSQISTAELSKNEVLDILPGRFPTCGEAWNRYLVEMRNDYDQFILLYKYTKKNLQIAHRIYLKEIKKLRDASQNIEKREQELLCARMNKKFQEIEDIKNGSQYYTELELVCMENLTKAQACKHDIQEMVLLRQAELKMHINACNKIKNDLRAKFDKFCMHKFNIPLECAEDEICQELKIEEYDEESDVNMLCDEKIQNLCCKFKQLRKLMYDEIKRNMTFKQRCVRWRNY